MLHPADYDDQTPYIPLRRVRFKRPALPVLGGAVQTAAESRVLLGRIPVLIRRLPQEKRREPAAKMLAIHAAVVELFDQLQAPYLADGV
jgi:hypothetical protein